MTITLFIGNYIPFKIVVKSFRFVRYPLSIKIIMDLLIRWIDISDYFSR